MKKQIKKWWPVIIFAVCLVISVAIFIAVFNYDKVTYGEDPPAIPEPSYPEEDPFSIPVFDPPEIIPQQYYYDLEGTYVEALQGFFPITYVDDLDTWKLYHPHWIFSNNDGTLIYVCDASVESDLASQSLGSYTCYCEDVVVLKDFTDCLLSKIKEDAILCDSPGATTNAEVGTALLQEEVTGYNDPDVFRYAIATLGDGRRVAVVNRDYGYGIGMEFIGPDEYTYELRENDTVLLVQETGELINLSFQQNEYYVPNGDIIP